MGEEKERTKKKLEFSINETAVKVAMGYPVFCSCRLPLLAPLFGKGSEIRKDGERSICIICHKPIS